MQTAVIAQDSKTVTIRGKTTNAETGTMITDVQVTMRLLGRGEVAASAISDTTGAYEIRIVPGLYSISAAKDGFVMTSYLDVANVPALKLDAGEKAIVDFRMLPGAAIAGNVTDIDGAPIADANIQAMMKIYRQGKIELQLRATARTDEHGEYRLINLLPGRYFLEAGKRATAAPGMRTFAEMTYPGASRIEDAQPIRVAAGERRSAINFRLRDAAQYSVSGLITFPDTGQPVANMAIRADPDFPGFGIRASTQSRSDGTFHLEGLTAGRYRMEGMLVGGDDSPRGYFLRFFELSAADITNMLIKVATGTTVKGNLRAVGGSLPERMSVQLAVRNPFGGTGYALNSVASAPNGNFQIRDVQPGIFDVLIRDSSAIREPAREFYVAAVIVDGQDVSDSGVRVPEGNGTVEVSVPVDFRPGTITGNSLNFDNSPMPGANLALMSADPKRRLQAHYWRQIKSDREGAFRFQSLVPGDYLLMIWPGYRPWEGIDPDAFEILEKAALRVRVERGGIVSRDVRLVKEVQSMLNALSP
jgi:protocatechuate 3,4-dioxygenase beta subunit